MKNTNAENRILDLLRSPEGVNMIERIVKECLDAKIKEIMASSGLSEIEAINRLRGVHAAEA